jgi:serine/threonine protein kinase
MIKVRRYILIIGYLRITDFGVAKLAQKENSQETSGTPGYMAPEVMCAQNHSFAVDYFALGVIAFEFMNGYRPYLGKSRKEIKELILAKQVQIKQNEVPPEWSIEAADFINKVRF